MGAAFEKVDFPDEPTSPRGTYARHQTAQPFNLRSLLYTLAAKQPFMPPNDAGVAALLVKFDTNITASSNALATKYGITTTELNRIRQARYVWQWFLDALGVAREWAQSLTASGMR